MYKDRSGLTIGQRDITPPNILNSIPRLFILIVALIAALGGALYATKTLAVVKTKTNQAQENARPANVVLTKITAPDCLDCFNLDDAVATLTKQNVSLTKEETLTYDSSAAQTLIKQHEIKQIPTYILSGEIDKPNIAGFIQQNGEVSNETFVFTNLTPVFIDPASNRAIGRVTATILTDPSCPQCLDPILTVQQFKQTGVKITTEKEVPWTSLEAQRIISQYKITKIPAFIFSPDIAVYPSVKSVWPGIGTIEADETYVARNLYLPYRDLAQGRILGLVDVIYLTDAGCGECYNAAEVHRNILTRGFGMGLKTERTVDIASSEGQRLIKQYQITKVPTLLMSPAAKEYPNLQDTWKQIGTIEPNGWYIFRDIARIGNITYKDLSTGQVIPPATPADEAPQP